MNRSPSRNPAFIAIACIAMAGAWSTGAFEVEQAQREPASVDRVALLRDAPDCLDVSGTRRALCLYESTRVAPTPLSGEVTRSAAPVASESPRPLTLAERSAVGRAQERSLLAPRSSSTAATMSR